MKWSRCDVNNDLIKSPYVKAYVSKKRKAAIICLIISLLCLGYGGAIGFNNVKEIMTSYDPVEVTATDEFKGRQAVGTRKSRRMVEVRMVGVELPDGSRGEVRSDKIEVGEKATVLQSSANGNLYEEQPDGPSFLEWLITVGALAIGILFFLLLLNPISQIRAVKRASKGDKGQLQLEVTHFDNELFTNGQIQLPAVIKHSTFEQLSAGTTIDISIDKLSTVPELPNPVQALVLKYNGDEVAVVLALQGKDQWYIGYGETEKAKAKRLAVNGMNQ